jgi:cytochrome c oxidase cbb3-type subunit 2
VNAIRSSASDGAGSKRTTNITIELGSGAVAAWVAGKPSHSSRCFLTLKQATSYRGQHEDVNLRGSPRNFTLATFKCRSTPTGTLPSDEDLFNTVGRGLESSNMPSWNPLSNQMRADLVAYVKHFSERWKTEKPGAPIEIPAEPAVTADRIKAGQAVFQKLECWKCHGVEGRGNGPSADTLTDDQNRPIKPFNFHDQTRFKCGTEDRDLYRIFMTGLDGTPMPSFADNVKPDEAWDLVLYLRTLQPMHTKEKEIARQLGLKPINPNAPAAPTNETKPEGENK